MKIGGMGSAVSPYAIRLALHGEESMGKADESLHLEARVMESIPQPTSTASLKEISSVPFLEGCPLADPDYGPGSTVDIILDNKSWYLCRTGGIHNGPQRGMIADGTIFGWVVGGTQYAKNVEETANSQILLAQPSDERLDDLLETHWLTEEPSLLYPLKTPRLTSCFVRLTASCLTSDTKLGCSSWKTPQR